MVYLHPKKVFRKAFITEARRYGLDRKDIDKMKSLFDQVPGDVLLDIGSEEAYRLARLVTAEINAQPNWWPPLKPDYLERKRSQGLAEEMLIATSSYRDSIGIQNVMRGKRRIRIQVGVPNFTHEPSGLNYNTLGRIHEYGVASRNIPARPHWGPAYRRWRNTIPRMINRVFGRVSNRLRKEMKTLLRPEKRAKKV